MIVQNVVPPPIAVKKALRCFVLVKSVCQIRASTTFTINHSTEDITLLLVISQVLFKIDF